MVERIVLKHVSGSKATEVVTFTLPLAQEIIFGRDAAAQVGFDAVKDDLVSRLHARLSQDPTDSAHFIVTDLNSRNGTFVNKIRIAGPVRLKPGDVIQLGANGPEIAFDLDPRPAMPAPVTRLIADPASAQTRESQVPVFSRQLEGPSAQAEKPDMGAAGSMGSTNSIGRATVERLIHQTKSSNRKLVVGLSAGIIAVVLIVVGALVWHNRRGAQQVEAKMAEEARSNQAKLDTIQDKVKEVDASAGKSTTATEAGKRIAEDYIPSTVSIEVSWKLIHIPSGKQLYHVHMNGEEMGKAFNFGKKENKFYAEKYKKTLPVYIIKDGVIEPVLQTDNDTGRYKPIGGSHTGSGFVVTDNGFILTNRHVAASWEDEYYQSDDFLPGYVLMADDTRPDSKHIEVLSHDSGKYATMLRKWVPANTSYLGGKPVQGKILEGRLDYLNVTFPKSTVPVRASLERVSDSADVALIKIAIPHSVKPVTLCENQCLSVGEMVTVLGYPAVSAQVYAQGASFTPFHREGTTRMIPDATVTRGNVQKIIKAEADTVGGPSMKYYSPFGDVYQLAINTTGEGNSGGPVFNDKGEVVGIFTYRKTNRDNNVFVSMAVPIKHGLDLMGIQRVIK